MELLGENSHFPNAQRWDGRFSRRVGLESLSPLRTFGFPVHSVSAAMAKVW